MIRPAFSHVRLQQFGTPMLVSAAGSVSAEGEDVPATTPAPAATSSAALTEERIDLVVQLSGLFFGGLLGAAAAATKG